MPEWKGLRIGYAPYSPTFEPPGDRRRFCFWAAERGVAFELADPRKDYDLVYLTTRSDISSWARFGGRARIIFELIDSYLALDPRRPKNILRGLAKFATRELKYPTISYRRALEVMCERADGVVCSTHEQKSDIEVHNDNVRVILDAHEEISGHTKTDHAIGDTLHLIWEGLPQNLANFKCLGDSLRNISAHTPLVLHLVTDPGFNRYLGRFVNLDTRDIARHLHDSVQVYPWTSDNLIKTATRADMAIIPLDLTDPMARGKPENKLLLFWRLGVPTVVSATPAYVRTMDSAGVDMYCSSPSEWESKLLRFSEDLDARRDAARAGLRYVEEHHSKETLLAQWDALFEAVLS